MAVEFQQGDTNATTCTIAQRCAANTVSAGTTANKDALVGGSTGITSTALSLPSSQTNRVQLYFDCYGHGAFNVAAGTLPAKLTIDSVGANPPLLDRIDVCHLDSACNVLATLGSLTGLASILGIGTRTDNVTVAGAAIGATDRIAVIYTMYNGSTMSAATATFVPDQKFVFQEDTAVPSGNQLPLTGCG